MCEESNESDVAPKAASLLSRGAAADCSPGALAQLEFQMVCEGTGWGQWGQPLGILGAAPIAPILCLHTPSGAQSAAAPRL